MYNPVQQTLDGTEVLIDVTAYVHAEKGVPPQTLLMPPSACWRVKCVMQLSWSENGFTMRFNELVRRLEQNGFRIVKEKGSIRYYGKRDWSRLVRVDYHGSKEVPTGTCHAILKAAGITEPSRD